MHDFPQLVIRTLYRPVFTRRHRHAPLKQVVNTGTPADSHLPPRIFSNIPPYRTSPFTGWISSKNKSMLISLLHCTLSNHSRFKLKH